MTASDSCHSPLSDSQLAQSFAETLEVAFGHRAKVVGILQIGSFATAEAVPESDIDTRVYVFSPDVYLVNIFYDESGSTFFHEFLSNHDCLDRLDFRWPDFNEPVSLSLADILGRDVHFGFVDRRYVEYTFRQIERHPFEEHSYLVQSDIVYDPESFLANTRRLLQDVIHPTLIDHYRLRVQRSLERVRATLQTETSEMQVSPVLGRIEWVNEAVKLVREAAGAYAYRAEGHLRYQKNDILELYKSRFGLHFELVSELYRWKTDTAVRNQMLEDFRIDPKPLSERFDSLMPELEELVRNLESA